MRKKLKKLKKSFRKQIALSISYVLAENDPNIDEVIKYWSVLNVEDWDLPEWIE